MTKQDRQEGINIGYEGLGRIFDAIGKEMLRIESVEGYLPIIVSKPVAIVKSAKVHIDLRMKPIKDVRELAGLL